VLRSVNSAVFMISPRSEGTVRGSTTFAAQLVDVMARIQRCAAKVGALSCSRGVIRAGIASCAAQVSGLMASFWAAQLG